MTFNVNAAEFLRLWKRDKELIATTERPLKRTAAKLQRKFRSKFSWVENNPAKKTLTPPAEVD